MREKRAPRPPPPLYPEVRASCHVGSVRSHFPSYSSDDDLRPCRWIRGTQHPHLQVTPANFPRGAALGPAIGASRCLCEAPLQPSGRDYHGTAASCPQMFPEDCRRLRGFGTGAHAPPLAPPKCEIGPLRFPAGQLRPYWRSGFHRTTVLCRGPGIHMVHGSGFLCRLSNVEPLFKNPTIAPHFTPKK